MSEQDIERKRIAKAHAMYKGHLNIDRENGMVTFVSGGITVLRVTHLREPVPQGVMIDIVSLPNLTSYTPLQQPEPGQHVESFQEWRDEGIEPARELGPE